MQPRMQKETLTVFASDSRERAIRSTQGPYTVPPQHFFPQATAYARPGFDLTGLLNAQAAGAEPQKRGKMSKVGDAWSSCKKKENRLNVATLISKIRYSSGNISEKGRRRNQIHSWRSPSPTPPETSLGSQLAFFRVGSARYSHPQRIKVKEI